MIRKLILGIIVSAIIVIAPCLGNLPALRAPQLWILLATGILASLFQPAYNPFDRTGKTEDRGTAAQILWSIYISQVLAIIESVYIRYPTSFQWNYVVTAALTCMILGLVLRTWAVYTLGKYFTWHIEVQDDQPVIRSGPFRFIRHPSYTGALLTYCAAAVFLQAWYASIISLLVLPIAFMRRIRYEEAHLKVRLGEAYKKYCHEVRGLIPWPRYFGKTKEKV